MEIKMKIKMMVGARMEVWVVKMKKMEMTTWRMQRFWVWDS